MGIPVLHDVSAASIEIVERNGVDLVFGPKNVEGAALTCLAQARPLSEQLRSRCLAAAVRYDRTDLALRMLAIIDAIAAASVMTTAICAARTRT